MRFIVSVLILSLCMLMACKNEQPTSSTKLVYIDLKSVVQSDIDSNTKNQKKETKIITMNGTQESQQLDSVDWQKEMELLLNCDINKSDWKDKFTTQNIASENKIVYTTNSSKIPIKKMSIYFLDSTQKVKYIEVEKETSTILFSNKQHIIYYPFQSFKINTQQKLLFMRDFNAEIEIKY